MKTWLRRLAAGLVLLLAVATLAVWLAPLESYLPRIEAAAAQALDQPVKIGGIGARLLPSPRLRLTAVSIGPAGELAMQRIDLSPDLASLLGAARRIRRIEIEDVSAVPDFVLALAGRPAADGAPAVAIGAIALRRVKLVLPTLRLPELDADISLDAAGRPERVELADTDGRLRATLAPADGRRQLTVGARDWVLPVGAPLRIDSLAARGVLGDGQVDFGELKVTLYQGELSGRLRLGWNDGLNLAARLEARGLHLAPLLAALTPRQSLSGRLDTQARVEARARDAARLAEALRVDGSFVVHEGVLHGVDLAGAARLVGAREGRGGETRFDQLSGNYQLRGKALRLAALQASSGTLQATGQVDISPARQLAGKVAVDLKTGVSLVTVPLRVSGTLQEPVVLPTGAAVAGAAAGTAVLGPGMGTSLGVKAAEAIDRLFGGGK